MDIIIILFWLFALILYIFIQIVWLKKIDRNTTLSWQMKLLYIIPIVISLFVFSYKFIFENNLNSAFGYSILLYFLILISYCIYLLSVYSFFESSITVKLLSIISEHSDKGIAIDYFSKTYNWKYIIDRRLIRFLALNQIQYVDNHYQLSQNISAFSIRSIFSKFFRIFFPLL
jgi:hypothetical protein